MALKFGSLFNDVFAGFKQQMGSVGSEMGKYADNFNDKFRDVDISGITAAESALATINEASKKTAQEIKDLNDELLGLTKNTPAHIDKLKQLAATNKIAEGLAEQEAKAKSLLEDQNKMLIESEKERVTSTVKAHKSIDDANSHYLKQLTELQVMAKANAWSVDELNEEMNKAKFNMWGEKFAAGIDNAGNAAKAISTEFTSGVGKFISNKLPPQLKFIADIIVNSLSSAIKQITELNDKLINLQRASGGLINPMNMGYDAFGNAKNGMDSLATTTLKANISVEQFSQAMQSLYSDGFGQTLGMVQNLKNIQGELQNFGVEAGRMKKLFNADIGPAVRNLSKNWGVSIKDATKLTAEGAAKVQLLGLSVSDYAKNLADVTSLVGEVYFKTNEEMQKMAILASQLGVNVNALAKGMFKMKGINELFQQQQKAAALGMNTTAKALAQVYALRSQGKAGEAAKLEAASIAQDMVKQGLTDDKGQISQQGLATLDAAGIDKAQIEGIQQLARQAQRTGIALDKLGDTSKLTAKEQLILARDQKANMKVGEQWDIIVGSLKQTLVDPIAKIFGPVLKTLLNVLQPVIAIITDIASTLIDMLSPAIALLTTAFDQVGSVITDIVDPISRHFKTMREQIAKVTGALSSISTFITKFVALPFRIVSKIIGGLITVVSRVITTIAEKLAPTFEWLTELFDGGGTFFQDVLDAVDLAFGWLADGVGWAVGALFDALVGVLKIVVNVFKLLWKGISWIGELIMNFISPALSFFGNIIEDIIGWFKKLANGIKEFFSWLMPEEETGAESAPAIATDYWNQALGSYQEQSAPALPKVEVNSPMDVSGSTSRDAELNAKLRSQATNFSPNLNTVTNVQVSGVVSSSQSVKKQS
jgi:phage-related protein